MTGVKWPGDVYNAQGDDLSEPIGQLLKDLELLEDRGTEKIPQKVTLRDGTPTGLQVLTSGATSLAKWMATAVAGLGGIGAAATAIKGFLANDALAPVYIRSTAICVVAAAVGIAVIVAADVLARAKGMAAEYEARASVATALLDNLQFGRPPANPNPPATGYWVKRKFNGEPNSQWKPVDAFELSSGGQVLAVVGNERYSGADIDGWITQKELVKAASNGVAVG